MNARKLAIAGGVLGAGAIAAVLMMSGSATDESPSPVAKNAPAASATHEERADELSLTGEDPNCVFEPGARFAASYSAKTRWQLPGGFAGMTSRDLDGSVDWAAHLSFEVLEASAKQAVLLVGVADPSSALIASAGEEVGTAFLAQVDSSCAVTGFARHDDTPVRSARVQQSLLHELWFSMPQAHAAPVRFSNAMGRAVGTVERGAGESITRRIDSYSQLWSSGTNGLRVIESSLIVERGNSPWFASMRGVESFTSSSVSQGEVELAVDMLPGKDADLKGLSRESSDYVWENLLRPIAGSATAKKPARHDERVAEMQNVNLPTALNQFFQRIESGQNFDDQWRDMAAFLDAHPDRIKEYASALVTQFDPSWRAAGFVALSQTQHPAAREVLLELYDERTLAPMDRVRGSLALATRHDVGAAVARRLTMEMQMGDSDSVGVGKHAMLHLGVLAGTHPDDEDVQQVAYKALSTELSSVQNLGEAMPVFAAIGNTGIMTFLATLEHWSLDDDPMIRAKVPIGMRRMPVDRVRDFTLEWLNRETSPEVIRELFEVIHHQYHDADVIMDDEMLAETVRHLDAWPQLLARQSVYRLLTPAIPTHDWVRSALRTALKREYEERSGLSSYLLNVLPSRDGAAALASIDSLNDQNPQAYAPPPTPPPEPEEETPPPGFLPDLPTEDELNAPIGGP